MKIYDFSHKELELAGMLSDNTDVNIQNASKLALELIQKLESDGHDYNIQKLATDLMWKLVNGKLLSPLSDDNWIEYMTDYYYHQRCKDLIKTPYDRFLYNKAIVFSDNTGTPWTGWVWLDKEAAINKDLSKKINSYQRIKGFPFTPKSFFVNVSNVEVGDEIQVFVTNPESLYDVWDYYNNPF